MLKLPCAFCIFDNKDKVCLEKLSIYIEVKQMLAQHYANNVLCGILGNICIQVSIMLVLYVSIFGKLIFFMKILNFRMQMRSNQYSFQWEHKLALLANAFGKDVCRAKFLKHPDRMLCFKFILTLVMLKKYFRK